MSITGAADGEPVKVGVAITDLTTGLYTKGAILAVLLHRYKTGKGQKIDSSLLVIKINVRNAKLHL
jgi:succinate--hydroxymethylglutarate CoA-transferase